MEKKNKYFNRILILCLILIILIINFTCGEKSPQTKEVKEYVSSLLVERAEKDSAFQFDIHSPFRRDTSIKFSNLKYFEPDPGFIFKSKLFFKEVPDTLTIMGTKGEARKVILIGHVELNKDDKIYKVNIYKGYSRSGEEYYSIWFTDKTTGKETYGVGRYLDFELNPDKDFVYTIDFNKAYNPYCAYTPTYSCPIPRVEDYIDMAVEAGEKNFH
jgi:uncharacterized protein